MRKADIRTGKSRRSVVKAKDKLNDFTHEDVISNKKDILIKNLNDKSSILRQKLKAKNENQKLFIQSIIKNKIIIATGPAGTGKTYIALSEALNKLVDEGNKINKIYLTKPITELQGESLGFHPGDLKEKYAPYIESYLINLYKLIGNENTKMLIENNFIEFQPLAYVRGRNNDNCIVLVDEAQNITTSNMRTLLTRIGDDCHYIIMGDPEQIDLKNKKHSSLSIISKIFDNIEHIGIVHFTDDDIVRNELIKIIELKFKEYFNNENRY